ncbi:zinc finger MYM-type protein 1-like [Aphis gossypii]|uniref:zinc finger MYM-type protein 1-like n=1 Tax=Aphis gossypii TaxID=80765 RepID=UPI0021592B82|nr:zinc finger MYM-type protein 1-like [Aphis gossypii]
MTSVTGQSIFDSINMVLGMINKDWSSVLAVCFDGASSMSGHVGGVQAKCKEKNNKILYVHCYAHCLNLILIDSICEHSSTPNNRLIFNFLGTIQFIYNFIEGSPMRHAVLEKFALETGSHLKSLKSCSITRWACRSEAVSAVKNNYSILIVAIDEICKNCTVPCMKAKGIGLLHQLQSFEFVLGLHLMEPILKIILKVSSGLQSPKLDLLTAINSIQALKNSLIFMRNDTFFQNIFEEVTTKCIDLDINIPMVKRKKVTVKLDNNYSNQFFDDSKYDELRCSVFNPLIDNLVNGLSIRFNQENLDLISAVGNLLKLELNNSFSNILSKLFNISIDELETEIKILKHMPDVPSGTSSESIYVWLDWLKESGRLDIFNNMYLVLKMFTIIPVTSCTCERVFSKLSIVKNKLRCTMCQDRLESLLLIFTEQELACKLDFNEIVDEFKNDIPFKRRLSL